LIGSLLKGTCGIAHLALRVLRFVPSDEDRLLLLGMAAVQVIDFRGEIRKAESKTAVFRLRLTGKVAQLIEVKDSDEWTPAVNSRSAG
jgi:hypothetical protein